MKIISLVDGLFKYIRGFDLLFLGFCCIMDGKGMIGGIYMTKQSVYDMKFSKVYLLPVAKGKPIEKILR